MSRQCTLRTNYVEVDTSTSSDGNSDPYKVSGDEGDVDFQMPKRLKKNYNVNSLKSKRSVLTPSQRIKRVKLKTLNWKKNETTENVNGTIQHAECQQTVNKPSMVTYKNQDYLFDQSVNAERAPDDRNDELAETGKSLCSNEIEIAEPRNTVSNCCIKSSESIRLLNNQIIELTNAINLMRKQMSRIEMKSMEFRRTPGAIDGDILMDFESSLANEKLPLKTCIEVNEFEMKLRQDSEYRNKMVKYP